MLDRVYKWLADAEMRISGYKRSLGILVFHFKHPIFVSFIALLGYHDCNSFETNQILWILL